MKIKLLLLGFIVLILYSINTHAQIPPFPDGYDTNNINTNYYNPYGDFNPTPTFIYPTNATLKWYLQFGNLPDENLLSLAPDGTLYVPYGWNAGPQRGQLYSVDTSLVNTSDSNYPLPDNFLKWTYDLYGGGVPYTPTIGADGSVLIAGTFFSSNGVISQETSTLPPGVIDVGGVAALDATNAAMRWAFCSENLSGEFSMATEGNDGTYYAIGGGYLCAFTNAFGVTNSFTNADGYVTYLNNVGLKWMYNGGGTNPFGVPTTTVGKNGTIYVFNSTGNVIYAFNPTNGTLKWKTEALYSYGSGYDSIAIGSDGTLLMPQVRYFCAIDPNGSVNSGVMEYKWIYTNDTPANFVYSPVVGVDGTVYAETFGFGTTNNQLIAFDPNSGTVKWKDAFGDTSQPYGAYHYPGANWKHGSLAVACDDEIYLADSDGTMYSFAPDGSTNWSYSTGTQSLNSPLIAPDGTVYVESLDPGNIPCYVYAFQGQSPIACSGWPEDGRNARRTSAVATATTSDPMVLTNGFRFSMIGNTNFPVCAFASSDLMTWTNLGQRILIGGMTNFVDIDSSNYPYRFYRAMPQ